MDINKSDFKTIFNKMVNWNAAENENFIKSISLYGKSGDRQIDNLIDNYSPFYISKVMKKINKKILIGGTTSEQPSEQPASTNVENLSVTEAPIDVPSTINIVDNVSGNVQQAPVEPLVPAVNLNVPSLVPVKIPSLEEPAQPSAGISDLLMMPAPSQEGALSETSTEMPGALPVNPEKLSETSTEMPTLTQQNPAHEEAKPESKSILDYFFGANTTEKPESESTQTTTEIPAPSVAVAVPEQKNENVQLVVKDLIEKLREKSVVLKEKESLLRSKESELLEREKEVARLEAEAKARIEELNNSVANLNTQKSSLESEVSGLKSDQEKYLNNLSEINLNLKDIGVTNTEDNATQSFLGSLFK